MKKPDEAAVRRCPAGKTLNRWVSEYVFGVGPRKVRVKGDTERVMVWTVNPAIGDGTWTADELKRYGQPREYSNGLAESMSVVKEMTEKGWSYLIQRYGDGHEVRLETPSRLVVVIAPSLCLAVARAALIAAMEAP